MKKILSGNHAAAVAAQLARVQVSVGYPITPATQVFEALAEMKSKGEFTGEFIAAESEHSVMAALLGAASAGARTFTATSSHGLAYMHEVLHWVAGARLPVVMVDVNRALAAPWNLWTDQTDSLSQRDTGWMQTYCSTNQEVLDTVLMSFKIAERV
ncbi:MAG: pyruvate ferredoxin oxidoreductase, partial [Elusimicrobiota bacterium]